MRYALKGSWTRSVIPAPGPTSQEVRGVEPAGLRPMPTVEVDAASLALALDQLAHQVLRDDRPLHDAWEQLRRDLLLPGCSQ